MKWLNYHHLLYFRTIVDEGGVARAARKLRLGQPTLSGQLKQLEENLGQKLFSRNGKRLELTEAGRVAYRYAKEIFALGEEMLQVFESGTVAGGGEVRIAALDNVPKRVLQALVKEARRLGADRIVVGEGDGAALFEQLSRHEVDLVITDFPPLPSVSPGNLYARELVGCDVAAFGAPRFAALQSEFPRSLSGQPIILPTGQNRLRDELLRTFHELGIKPVVVAETQDTALQRSLARGEIGLAFLPVFSGEGDDGTLLQLGVLPGLRSIHWLVAASRRVENPVASRLMFGFDFTL